MLFNMTCFTFSICCLVCCILSALGFEKCSFPEPREVSSFQQGERKEESRYHGVLKGAVKVLHLTRDGTEYGLWVAVAV